MHESGDYALTFEPGMVLTVEPGAYMADKGLGVRIEDDILVTEEGPVNLSAWAPRTVAAVEALMKAAQANGLDPAPLPEPEPLPRLRVRKGRLY